MSKNPIDASLQIGSKVGVWSMDGDASDAQMITTFRVDKIDGSKMEISLIPEKEVLEDA